ncbi:MAG: hypothetical protein FJ405_10150 [Verrucomicrobia bacterium]|nr:hypothetical protein [Verrucomicrobiota bacterium]
MFDFFRNWRERKTEAAFQKKVLRVLADALPHRKWHPGGHPEIILADGISCNLANLRATIKKLRSSKAEEKEMITRHVAAVLDSLTKLELDELDWPQVRDKVRIQLTSESILSSAPLAHVPLGGGLVKLAVVDSDVAFRYISAEDLIRWRINWDELEITACSNLNEACQGRTQVSYVPGPDRLIAVQTLDGFDAARILIPDFRAFVASKLGSPFLFGVPNRDFLICWSHDNSESFLKLTRGRLQQDHKSQPYPISPEVFEANRAQIAPWQPRN